MKMSYPFLDFIICISEFDKDNNIIGYKNN